MIACDRCGTWFHGACVGYEEQAAPHRDGLPSVPCPLCSRAALARAPIVTPTALTVTLTVAPPDPHPTSPRYHCPSCSRARRAAAARRPRRMDRGRRRAAPVHATRLWSRGDESRQTDRPRHPHPLPHGSGPRASGRGAARLTSQVQRRRARACWRRRDARRASRGAPSSNAIAPPAAATPPSSRGGPEPPRAIVAAGVPTGRCCCSRCLRTMRSAPSSAGWCRAQSMLYHPEPSVLSWLVRLPASPAASPFRCLRLAPASLPASPLASPTTPR